MVTDHCTISSHTDDDAKKMRNLDHVMINDPCEFSPCLRYLADKDVKSWDTGKKNMDELEFFNMIKGLIALTSHIKKFYVD